MPFLILGWDIKSALFSPGPISVICCSAGMTLAKCNWFWSANEHRDYALLTVVYSTIRNSEKFTNVQ